MKTLSQYIENLADLSGAELIVRFVTVVLIAWIPSQILSLAIAAVYPGPESINYYARPLHAIAMLIIIAPLLETFAMRFNFWAIRKLPIGKMPILWISALVWGVLHWKSESWGIPIVWVFFILGMIYLRAEAISTDRALLLTAAVHSTFNTLSYVTYLAFYR